jgi:hypothetical protein
VFKPVPVEPSCFRGYRLEQPELQQAAKPVSGAGRSEELEKLLTDPLARNFRN